MTTENGFSAGKQPAIAAAHYGGREVDGVELMQFIRGLRFALDVWEYNLGLDIIERKLDGLWNTVA